jgi:hypothetical protein
MLQLDRLTFSAYEDDFTLTINDQSCFLPSFVAELVSPRISTARKSDATILSYLCTTHLPIPESDIHAFFTYLRGGSLPPSSDSMILISYALGSVPDASSFSKQLTTENVVSVLHAKNLALADVTREIDYIARHLSTVKEATAIAPDDLLHVLLHEGLFIDSEDCLLSFVASFAHQIASYGALLECVQCEEVRHLDRFQLRQSSFPSRTNAGGLRGSPRFVATGRRRPSPPRTTNAEKGPRATLGSVGKIHHRSLARR